MAQGTPEMTEMRKKFEKEMEESIKYNQGLIAEKVIQIEKLEEQLNLIGEDYRITRVQDYAFKMLMEKMSDEGVELSEELAVSCVKIAKAFVREVEKEDDIELVED